MICAIWLALSVADPSPVKLPFIVTGEPPPSGSKVKLNVTGVGDAAVSVTGAPVITHSLNWTHSLDHLEYCKNQFPALNNTPKSSGTSSSAVPAVPLSGPFKLTFESSW